MSIDTTKLDLLGSSTEGTKTQGSNKLGKDEFLKILTVQLANQDPTKPMDSHAFVAQLAQFSALEQQMNSNEILTQVLAFQQSAHTTSLVNMVGKEATYDSQEMQLGSDGTITVDATLAADAGNVAIVVRDADGNLIRTQDFGPRQAGKVSVTWDGKNQNGAKQPPGSYSISVGAVDLGGDSVGVTQHARGVITGVTFAGDYPQFLIGNTAVPISQVQSIQESSNSQQ